MKSKIIKKYPKGFTLIVILLALVILIVLSLYGVSKTMKHVQNNPKDDSLLGRDTQEPINVQNYQQTLDSVRENLNQNAEKEQQRINEAQEEMK